MVPIRASGREDSSFVESSPNEETKCGNQKVNQLTKASIEGWVPICASRREDPLFVTQQPSQSATSGN